MIIYSGQAYRYIISPIDLEWYIICAQSLDSARRKDSPHLGDFKSILHVCAPGKLEPFSGFIPT